LNKTRKAIAKALRYQIENKGFSIVEVLSQCPTGWKMDPVESLDWIDKEMEPVFPLGVFKDAPKERPLPPHPAHYDPQQVRDVLFGHGTSAERKPSNPPILGNWPSAQGRSFTEVRLKSAGFGGQGILLLGELLAKAGIAAGLHATWLPSYGPEMRGGTANCSVVLSPSAIGNPMVERPNVLIAMNRPSLERFAPALEPGGILLYDKSLIDLGSDRDDIVQVPVAATQIADELGSAKVANVVMIGALMGILGQPRSEDLEPLLSELGRSDAVREANRLALQRGQEITSSLVKEVALSS
jgi:2-oxoisovalerate ferredoxin oxidoreductase beta subunit